jgi:hypothetical protein
MPPARDDVRLLVFAGAAVLLAGIAVAVLLFVSIGGDQPARDPEPVEFGLESSLRDELDEGPFFVPDQFGGDRSFWIAEEDGEIVAIATHQRALPDCSVKWKAQIDRFECGDDRFTSDELERFELTIPETGEDEGVVTIDVRRRIPAPSISGGN